MFESYKIKKLIAQLGSADEGSSRSRLIHQILEHKKSAFPYVIDAFQSKKLDPINAQTLLEKLYDSSYAGNLLSLTGDTYDAVRGVAKKLILKGLNREVIKKLIENLQSSNPYLKASATEILCNVKNQSYILELVSLYNKGDTELKLNIIRIVAETGGNVASKLLISVLKSREWRLRLRAVRCLGKMKDPKSVEPLIEILSEKDPQLKRGAIDALMEIGDKRAALPVLALLKDEDLIIRQNAVDCINQIADSEIISQVLNLMRDTDVNTRRCAVEIINKMKDPKTGDELVKAMKDSDWWVRNVAMEALADIKGENTIKILTAMLNDSDENIRRCAVEFFNKVSDASAIKPLIELLKDKDWWVREKAASALGRLKDKRAIEALSKLIDDDEIKWVVPGALGNIGGEEVVGPIVQFLGDTQKRVRIEAIRALTRLKDQDVVPELKQTLEDPEKEVRLEAAKALKIITGKAYKVKEDIPLNEQPQMGRVVGATAPEGSILTEAIVVVDLCNSTAIANKYGDQFALNLTKVLTDAVNPIVKREHAQFMKSTGDGFLITFPKIVNSIKFILDLQSKIRKYNKTVDEPNNIELRFAVNFGETRVDAKADRLGVATNMTFRVEGVKSAGLIEIDGGIKKDQMPGTNRVLVTENVVEEIEKIKGLKPKLLGLFELKGISGLHRIFELVREQQNTN